LPPARGFVVRDLPWTEEKLRAIPPFEFENWALIALADIPNKAQVADMGIDGRIFPVSPVPKKRGAVAGQLDFMDVWYPIQVKQKERVGRPRASGKHPRGSASRPGDSADDPRTPGATDTRHSPDTPRTG
jgi:hypothetical protein